MCAGWVQERVKKAHLSLWSVQWEKLYRKGVMGSVNPALQLAWGFMAGRPSASCAQLQLPRLVGGGTSEIMSTGALQALAGPSSKELCTCLGVSSTVPPSRSRERAEKECGYGNANAVTGICG